MKLADALATTLRDWDLGYLFGVSGANIEHLHDAVHRLGGERFRSVLRQVRSGRGLHGRLPGTGASHAGGLLQHFRRRDDEPGRGRCRGVRRVGAGAGHRRPTPHPARRPRRLSGFVRHRSLGERRLGCGPPFPSTRRESRNPASSGGCLDCGGHGGAEWPARPRRAADPPRPVRPRRRTPTRLDARASAGTERPVVRAGRCRRQTVRRHPHGRDARAAAGERRGPLQPTRRGRRVRAPPGSADGHDPRQQGRVPQRRPAVPGHA